MNDFDPVGNKRKYNALASESLKHAKALRAIGGARADTYAALELRHAFESIIYERALDYLADLSPDEIRIWRPHSLLEKMLEIDPNAEFSIELSLKDTHGESEWLKLGREQRIGLKELKKHYFALGNFLHAPPLMTVLNGQSIDLQKLSEQCDKSEVTLAKVLGSTLKLKIHEMHGRTSLKCSQCGATISRSLAALKTPENKGPRTREIITIECNECSASFDVFYREGDGIVWREQRWQQACPIKACDGWHEKWIREMKDGVQTICSSCGTTCELRQAYVFMPVESATKHNL